MKRKKQFMKRTAMLLIMGVLLAGCGDKSEGAIEKPEGEEIQKEAAPGESSQEEKIKITYMSRSTNEQDVNEKFMIDRLAKFQELNPDIIVEDLSVTELDAYNTKLKASVAAGEPIDMFANYGNNDISELVLNGVVKDITPLLSAEDWDGPVNDDMLKAWNYENRGLEGVYGVPTNLITNVFFVNTRILDECGLQIPETWEDIEKMVPVLTEKGYIPIALGAKTKGRVGHWHTNIAMKMYGLEYCNQLIRGEEKWTGEKMTAITNKLKSFIDMGMFGEYAISDDAQAHLAHFKNGEAAMVLDVNANIPGLSEMQDFDSVEISKVPYFENAPENKDTWFVSLADGFSITVDEDSPKYDAVVRLYKFMTSKDMFEEKNQKFEGGVYPVDVSGEVKAGRLMGEYMRLFSERTGSTDELDVYFEMPNTQEVVRSELQTLFAGNTVEEVLNKIQNELDAFTSK